MHQRVILSVLSSLAVSAIAAPRASATVTVFPSFFVQSQTTGPNGERIILGGFTVPNVITDITITSNSNDLIEFIRVNAEASGTVVRLNIMVGNDVDEVAKISGAGAVWILNLETPGDVGFLNTNVIVAAQVGGDLDDILIAQPPGGSTGNIIDVRVDGDLTGNVLNPWGIIDILRVDGRLGLTPNATRVSTSTRINELRAGEINAQITTEEFESPGQIVQILARRINGSSGNFNSDIDTFAFTGGGVGIPARIDIEGDFNGAATMIAAFPSDGAITIGDSLNTSGSITLPANGLQGQITVNNNDSGSLWSGDVVVGGATLAPVYSATAASLGGGAAGEVPFLIHASSSSPVDLGNINPLTSAPFSIRHYGPVAFAGVGVPVLVERAPVGSTNFTNQTAGFTYSVPTTEEQSLEATPVALYEYQNGYEYRVTPITTGADRLFCKDAVGTPGVASYVYSFTVGTFCTADLDGDGDVGSADLANLLGNWGATGLSEMGDLNNDGEVRATDLAFLLGSWGSNCGIPEATSGGGEPSVSPVLAELGFSSVNEYTSWLDTLSAQQCFEHACTVLESLQQQH